jgi:hypothetical protein
MTSNRSTNDRVETALRQGYDCPPPREEFVEGLSRRMQEEFRAARADEAGVIRAPWLARRWPWAAAAAAAVVIAGSAYLATREWGGPAGLPRPDAPVAHATPDDAPGRMVALSPDLPQAEFDGTPRNIRPYPQLEPWTDKPRPDFLVPRGTVNLAAGRPVKASDAVPIIGEAALVTDGHKATNMLTGFVELGPGTQWVQIDLGAKARLSAILVWHYHAEGRVYHDVVVQVSDDQDFIADVRTVYNNDFDNSSGLGVGKDLEYIEDHRGRLIDCGGAVGRYVRLYSRGNSSNDYSHYVEVEVFGKPVEAASTASPAEPSAAAPQTAAAAPQANAGASDTVPLKPVLPQVELD